MDENYNDIKKLTYHEQADIQNILKLREVLKTLPNFCKDFFRAIEPTTTTLTRVSYAYDIRIFFQFLLDNNPLFKNCTLKDITIDILGQLQPIDIEEYLDYLKIYKIGDKIERNGNSGRKRKLSALKSFYSYYHKHEYIHTNPMLMIEAPHTKDKTIIHLEADEVAMLLDYIENCGNELAGKKKVYYEKTKERDLAIITLMLGTGIRVSECVGLDIEDVDFKNNGLRIVRKGGNEMIVYFGPEVEKILKDYLVVRENIPAVPGHEHALFYSSQKKRIGVRTVETLVKKYSQAITTKKITPHKLRSTYGTALYQETGDIYLVADVLGHKDINTTQKHYAAMDDTRRRKAATAVHLRQD